MDKNKKTVKPSPMIDSPASKERTGQNNSVSVTVDADQFESRFRKAHACLESGQPAQAMEIGQALYDQKPTTGGTVHLELCRLLSFAYTQLEQPEQALIFALEGNRYEEDCLDFPFVTAIIYAKLRDYEKAVSYAKQYFSRLSNLPNGLQKTAQSGRWDSTASQKHQLLNAYGVAQIELGDHDGAEQNFREAITLKSNYDSPFINLSYLLISLGREEEATETIKQGISAVPDSLAMRKTAGMSGRRPTISVCMIVKNEQEFLPRCLASIRELADEIILVDTGSNDRTVEIANQFDCQVHHFPWQGDFSSARNESLRYATGDWIFIIDADEELPQSEIVKLRFFACQPDIKLISISVYNKSPETGKVSSFLPSVRLFRRELGLNYFGIVHNRLDIPDGMQPVRCNVHLYHYGYDLSRDKLDKKIARTRALLEKQLEEAPDDIFANFNMAQLLFGYGHSHEEEISRQIVFYASKVIESPESKLSMYLGQRIMAFQQKAAGQLSLKQYEAAEKSCFDALEEKSGYLDSYMTLGHIYLDTGRDDKAREHYHKYLHLQKEYRADDEVENIILRYLDSRHIAYFALGVIAHRNNEINEAIRCYEEVLKNKGGFKDTHSRLGKMYLDKEAYKKAEEMFRLEIASDPLSLNGNFGCGEALYFQGRFDEAIPFYDQAVDTDPPVAQIILSYGVRLLKMKKYDLATAQINRLVDLKGESFELYFESANILYEMGQYETAIKLYKIALKSNPNQIRCLNNLGNCYFKIENYEKACAIYEQLIDNDPASYPVYRNLGVVYARLDQIEKSLTCLTKYAGHFPEDVEVLKIIGDLFSLLGRYQEALPVYELCMQKNPNDFNCLFNISEAYYELNHQEAAVQGYRAVLKINPGCKPAQEKLAAIESLVAT